MFGIGMPELVVILVIALLIFGPKKLPELAKGIGKSINLFKQGLKETEQEIEKVEADVKNVEEEKK